MTIDELFAASTKNLDDLKDMLAVDKTAEMIPEQRIMFLLSFVATIELMKIELLMKIRETTDRTMRKAQLPLW